MTVDEIYDRLLMNELGVSVAEPDQAEELEPELELTEAEAMEAELEGPRGLARYRNAAMVGAGGLACAAVGALMGGFGGYFTVSPAAAHPVRCGGPGHAPGGCGRLRRPGFGLGRRAGARVIEPGFRLVLGGDGFADRRHRPVRLAPDEPLGQPPGGWRHGVGQSSALGPAPAPARDRDLRPAPARARARARWHQRALVAHRRGLGRHGDAQRPHRVALRRLRWLRRLRRLQAEALDGLGRQRAERFDRFAGLGWLWLWVGFWHWLRLWFGFELRVRFGFWVQFRLAVLALALAPAPAPAPAPVRARARVRRSPLCRCRSRPRSPRPRSARAVDRRRSTSPPRPRRSTWAAPSRSAASRWV